MVLFYQDLLWLAVLLLFLAWWIWYYSVSHQIKIGVDNLAKSTVPPLEDPEEKGKKVETGGWSTWKWEIDCSPICTSGIKN